MIPRPDLSSLPPARRAELIYAQARSELSTKLWRAALGDADESRESSDPAAAPASMTMDSLLAMLNPDCPTKGTDAGGPPRNCFGVDDEPPAVSEAVAKASGLAAAPAAAVAHAGSSFALGVNSRYASAFAAAEARTGIPASALASIIDAEAAKRGDGSWNAHSRNPRSSAAGLGQFLSGTWQDLAQTSGTWLNGVARQRGWLDSHGKVAPAARAELLSLRYDPSASIMTVGDLAKRNLDRLERDGFKVRASSETLAKAAYLSHHLGLGDTRRFLGAGIEPRRAKMLLAAQVGHGAAAQRIDQAGGATQAHRQWLLGYIGRRIQPGRFAA